MKIERVKNLCIHIWNSAMEGGVEFEESFNSLIKKHPLSDPEEKDLVIKMFNDIKKHREEMSSWVVSLNSIPKDDAYKVIAEVSEFSNHGKNYIEMIKSSIKDV